jgi:hypothetical protein
MGLVSRFIGIITSPKATYQAVVAHPRWFGMLALTTVIVTLATVMPLTTQAGQEAALEQQVSQMEAFGLKISDAQYEEMRGRTWMAPYTTGAGILVFAPVMAVIVSGVLFVVFNVVMGGGATFKQMFSVVVHAGAISALSSIFTGLINLASGTMRSSAANLGLVLPIADEGTFVSRLLGAIDLFVIWWLLVMAMGLAVLYRRRTQPIAVSLLVVYALIAVCIAAIMSAFGGGA